MGKTGSEPAVGAWSGVNIFGASELVTAVDVDRLGPFVMRSASAGACVDGGGLVDEVGCSKEDRRKITFRRTLIEGSARVRDINKEMHNLTNWEQTLQRTLEFGPSVDFWGT